MKILQLWLATVHLTAATIAAAIALTHAAAVRHHLNRITEPLADIEQSDISYAEAIARQGGRR